MKRTKLANSIFYEEAGKRLQILQDAKEIIEERLSKAPKGKIRLAKHGSSTQFYVRMSDSDKCGIYLRKNEEKKTRIYMQKMYDEKVIKMIEKEICSLERFLKSSSNKWLDIRSAFSKLPSDAKKYVDFIDCIDEEYAKLWSQMPYMRKANENSNLEQITDRGENVRSKSELNIANMLNKMGVPYRYECRLQLKDGDIFHPDFTILDVKRRREVYWEHRGMMDDRGYIIDSVQRMKKYMKNGIFLGDNLIITEETMNNQLGTLEIKTIINHYFK